LVADSVSPEAMARLERTANKQHGLMPGICAWALAVHHKRGNQPDKAADYKALLRLAIPYSVPLRQTNAGSS